MRRETKILFLRLIFEFLKCGKRKTRIIWFCFQCLCAHFPSVSSCVAVCVCVCACVWLSVSLFGSVPGSVWIYMWVYLSVRLSLSVCGWVSVCQSMCESLWSCFSNYISVYVCSTVSLSVCVSVCFCLCVTVSVSVSVPLCVCSSVEPPLHPLVSWLCKGVAVQWWLLPSQWKFNWRNFIVKVCRMKILLHLHLVKDTFLVVRMILLKIVGMLFLHHS